MFGSVLSLEPLTRPTFLDGKRDAVLEYMLADLSVKTILESLYCGISLLSIDRECGFTTFAVGEHQIKMPLGVIDKDTCELRRPISKNETLALARAACKKAGWTVCLEFIWVRKRLPIYAELYEAARDEMWVSSHCWVLAHALSILQTNAHVVLKPTFMKLIDKYSRHRLERTLEEILGRPWSVDEDQADQLFQFMQPFSLRPKVGSKQPSNGLAHVWVCDTVAIIFSLRELSLIAILCLAHANIIWPSGVPGVFLDCISSLDKK